MKKIATIVLAVVSLSLVVGTFFFDEYLHAQSSGEQAAIQVTDKGSDAHVQAGAQGIYEVDSGSKSPMTVRVGDNVVVRVAPETKAQIGLMQGQAFLGKILTINLSKGRLWLNTLNSAITTQAVVEGITVNAEPGVFDLQYGDGALIVSAYRRSAQLEFLDNRLLLPEGREITIETDKLTTDPATIRKLRYSKLSKEFPYTALSSADEWSTYAMVEDTTFAGAYRSFVMQEIRNGGPKLSPEGSLLFKSKSALQYAAQLLTIDQQKKAEKSTAMVLDYFDAGAYDILIGQDAAAQQWFTAFQKVSPSENHQLQQRIDRFSFAYPGDVFYPAKLALRSASRTSSFKSLHDLLNDILDVAASGSDSETQAKVTTMLKNFGVAVHTQLQQKNISTDFSDNLFFESIRYNDFLSRNPYLFNESFLRIGEDLERAYLAGIPSKEQADDQRAYLISEKLRTFGAVKALLEKDQIDFQSARSAMLLLVDQIEALRPAFSDTAVLSYFDDQLKQYGQLIAFLRESSSENLHGSFQQNFNDFTGRVEESKKINDLLGSAQGGTTISPYRREELAQSVSTDLGTVGVLDIKLTLPAAEDDPRVTIVSATFEGASFTGTYDTERKVLSDMTLNGQLIPNAIRLDNVRTFLLVKLGKVSLPNGATVESLTQTPPQQSDFEKVVHDKTLQELMALKINVDSKDIGLEDIGHGTIHVKSAVLGEGVDAIIFSFDRGQKDTVVSNLSVTTVMGQIPVNDTFALADLVKKVTDVHQRAIFDKEKATEEEKLSQQLQAASQPERVSRPKDSAGN